MTDQTPVNTPGPHAVALQPLHDEVQKAAFRALLVMNAVASSPVCHPHNVIMLRDAIADLRSTLEARAAAPEPLAVGTVDHYIAGTTHDNDDALIAVEVGAQHERLAMGDRVAIYADGQTPAAAVTREQVATVMHGELLGKRTTPMQYTTRIENAIDAVMALLAGEGSG